MRTTNKEKIKRVISGALASTFLLEACVHDTEDYYIDKKVAEINEKSNYNLRKGRSSFAIININLNEDDRKYFGFINKLTLDILYDKTIAQKVINNTQAYLNECGYSELIIDLDDELIKMITALGDDEIYHAIQNNNITDFIQLCKKKNIMSSIQISDIERIGRFIENNPELQHLLNVDDPEVINIAFAVAIAVGALVFIWAITITHAVAVNIVGGGTVYFSVWAVETLWKVKGHIKNQDSLIKNKDPHLLQVWALKGGNPENIHLLLNEYENTQINDFLAILEREFPEKFNQVDKEALKQVIALNLKQFSNL